MSSLYRSAISARIAKLPQLPFTDEDDVEQSELADEIGSLGMGPPPMYVILIYLVLVFPLPYRPRSSTSTGKQKPPNLQFQPLSPASYFSQALQIALPTRALDVRVYYTPPKYDGGGVIVLHHGAGYAGTSFACIAKEISEIMRGDVGVLAFDARRHGMHSFQRNAECSSSLRKDNFISV